MKKKIISILLIITIIMGLGNNVFALSSDISLKSLKITPGDDLKKIDESTYKISVGVNTTSVQIEAIPNVSNAQVSIEGNSELDVGTNIVRVIVTAEDGTKGTYTIKVRRLSTTISEENIVPNIQQPQTTESKVTESNAKGETEKNETINSINETEENVIEIEEQNIVEEDNEFNEVVDSTNTIEITNIDANSKKKNIKKYIIIAIIVIIIFVFVISKKGKKKKKNRKHFN